MNAKIASYIGMAQRAGGILYGEDIIFEKFKNVRLVLLDSEASDKYKERIKFKCGEVPVFEIENMCGALHRDSVKAIAVTIEGLADAIINLLR